MRDLSVGSVFAGYRIEALAGRGGMGVVYRARQERPSRTVALKIIAGDLAEDEEFRARFERESEVAASIEHPNVIPVYEVGDEAGRLFIAMRFVEGTDLRALIDETRGLDAERATQIIRDVAAALDAAHDAGLVHRDIKPANVLISGRSAAGHTYLTDFGLTKPIEGGEALTSTGVAVGTYDYMAPEQFRGEPVDVRTDVYALGCVFHHALTGGPPFPAESDAAKMYGHLKLDPPAPSEVRPGIPSALDAVISKAMAKEPSDRFGSAGELGRAALGAAGGEPSAPSSAAPTPTPEPPERGLPDRRRAITIALIGAAVVVVAAAAAVVAGPLSDGGDDGDAKLTAACTSHAEVTDGFNEFFRRNPALQRRGGPPKSATAQIQASFDRLVAPSLERLKRNAPEPIAGDIESAGAIIAQIRSGDLSEARAPAYSPTTERIDGYFFDNCSGQKGDVKGVEYAFDGLEPTYSRGLTRIKFVNGGKELHELAIVRRKAGVTEPFTQILKLPLPRLESKIEQVDNANPIMTGQASYAVASLSPGRYLVVCALSRGTTSLEKPGKGPPHFRLGMQKEFTVG